MIKYLMILAAAFSITACSSDDDSSSTDDFGDLIYANSSSELGRGFDASGTANQFLDCSGGSISNRFKKLLPSKMLVAFGVSEPVTYCGSCAVQFKCTPNESFNVDIVGYSGGSTYASPSDFDEDQQTLGFNQESGSIVCPPEGVYSNAGSNSYSYMKVTLSTQPVSGSTVEPTEDTEYLSCGSNF